MINASICTMSIAYCDIYLFFGGALAQQPMCDRSREFQRQIPNSIESYLWFIFFFLLRSQPHSIRHLLNLHHHVSLPVVCWHFSFFFSTFFLSACLHFSLNSMHFILNKCLTFEIRFICTSRNAIHFYSELSGVAGVFFPLNSGDKS